MLRHRRKVEITRAGNVLLSLGLSEDSDRVLVAFIGKCTNRKGKEFYRAALSWVVLDKESGEFRREFNKGVFLSEHEVDLMLEGLARMRYGE